MIPDLEPMRVFAMGSRHRIRLAFEEKDFPLRPGMLVVEDTNTGLYRLTNDIHNQWFSLPDKHKKRLKDTGTTTEKIFCDPSR